MKTIDEIRAFFDQDHYACGLTGIYIEEAAPGYSRLSLEIEEKHLNGSGHVMGGAYFTLADLAVAVAANQDFENEISVAVNSQISFIASVTGGKIFAEAHIVKDGRKILFCEVKITDAEGKLLATSSTTSYRVSREK